MPNGSDAYWMRFCMAVNGFRGMHGKWPTRVRLDPELIDILERILGLSSFAILVSHIELIPDEEVLEISAEDNKGLRFVYGKDMDKFRQPEMTIIEWLGVDSLPEYQD